jgi:hypothetical protein
MNNSIEWRGIKAIANSTIIATLDYLNLRHNDTDHQKIQTIIDSTHLKNLKSVLY